jgi:hypothetical protein
LNVIDRGHLTSYRRMIIDPDCAIQATEAAALVKRLATVEQ